MDSIYQIYTICKLFNLLVLTFISNAFFQLKFVYNYVVLIG